MSAQISNANDAISWLAAQGIQRVEVVFADLTSVARGKAMDSASFVEALGAKMPTLLLGLARAAFTPFMVWMVRASSPSSARTRVTFCMKEVRPSAPILSNNS